MERLERDVQVAAGDVKLPGKLTLPREVIGIVIFAHGSGSSRFSTRNVTVARTLVERGCATLLFDLLTDDEAFDRRNVFDIPLLGQRMVDATNWVAQREEFRSMPIGHFGASTGAAAALVAAAKLPDRVAAVVSRGGRPDLAHDALEQVRAPSLLIVGSLDTEVLELNRQAQSRLTCENHLEVVPGASHLFEEPGTLEDVSRIAGEWFVTHFRSTAAIGADRGSSSRKS
jgi:putative phosphoribosyl transferase